MGRMKGLHLLLLGPIAAAALPAWGCAGPGRLPEGEIPPSLALSKGSLVLVRVEAAPGSLLDSEGLAALLEGALEQSPILDFLVLPAGKPGPREIPPAGRVELSWGPLPGSKTRKRLLAEASRPPGKEGVVLQVVPRKGGFPGLEAALDSMGRILRRTFGEDRDSILTHCVPLARAFTPSRKALEAFLEARRLVRRGKVPEAGRRIQEALKEDPRFGKALLLLASLLLDGGASYQSLRVLERAGIAAVDMDAPDRHVLERLRLRAAGKYEELLAEGEDFLEEYPASPEGLFTKALALNLLAREAQALPIWRRLHRRDPRALTPVFQIGAALFGMGRFREARTWWDRLGSLGARPLQAAFFAALPRIATGDLEGARKKVEEAMARAPRRADLLARFHLMLCSLSILGRDVPRADEEARKVLEISRADPAGTMRAWTLAARYLLFRGKDKAVKSFLSLLPLSRPAGRLEDIRLAGIWLQGLMAAKDPGNALADKAALTLSEEGKSTYSAELQAEIAKSRDNPTARIFNLRQAQGGYPSLWNDYRLGKGLLETGARKEARVLLEAVVTRGLRLDANNLHLHPAANPLSAAALLEARRLLDREKREG